MAKIFKPRTLEKIAVKIRDLAYFLAPEDTGRLKRYIKKANTPAKTKMIKQSKDFTTTISLDYAGGDQKYGEYWNEPYGYPPHTGTTLTIRKRYPQHFNYAIKALDNPEFNRLFDEYLKELGDFVISEIEIEGLETE